MAVLFFILMIASFSISRVDISVNWTNVFSYYGDQWVNCDWHGL